MAGKNQKSSTLPPGLRYGVQQSDDNEGFFSKLKKKLKLKKGKYTVDVNTGECENISAVSFRKRESRDIGDEPPWKLRDDGDFERETRSHSPRQPKHASRTLSDRIQGTKPGKSKHERKHSFPENQILALRNSPNLVGKVPETSGQGTKNKVRVGNEYSRLDYENREIIAERPRLSKGGAITNHHLIQDESAIDLDNVQAGQSDPNYVTEIGYQAIPARQKDRADSESALSDPQKSPDWDPRYESLNDVKQKLREQFHDESKVHKSSVVKDRFDFDPQYQSVSEAKGEDLTFDPGYQSVQDVKKQILEDNHPKPAKTYNVNQSIESLDEPGYECLNDVKKRAMDQSKAKSKSKEAVNELVKDTKHKVEKLSLENLSGSRTSERRHSGTPDSGSGIKGLTEIAVSLTGIATALTGSGISKDSGFQSKTRSVDSEMEENLYSSVKKSCSSSNVEGLYNAIKKNRAKSVPELELVQSLDNTKVEAKTLSSQNVTQSSHHNLNKMKEKSPSNDVITATSVVQVGHAPPVDDDYDSDFELILDPGYAECADAIKGYIPPSSIYSEGSGSKISSCTSLDLSAEDFILEPGYAECADAIKTGAIKKVSVSHERLVDYGTDGKYKHDISSEIYANPQILFRKRSKMLEDGTSDGQEKTDDPGGSKAEKVDKKKKKQAKVEPSEAPPLPARNYSLYLENEEAERVVKEVLDDITQENDKDLVQEDDAFEVKKESGSEKSGSDSYLGCGKTRPENSNNDCEADSTANKLETTGLENAVRNVNIEGQDKGEHSCCCDTNPAKEQEDNENTGKTENVACKGDDECFHVTVRDRSGSEKVLRIVEKEESFKIKNKRKESKKRHKEDKGENCDNIKDTENVQKVSAKLSDSQTNFDDTKASNDVTNTDTSHNNLTIPGCNHEIEKDSLVAKESEISDMVNNFTNNQTKDIDPSSDVRDCDHKETTCTDSVKIVNSSVPHIETEIHVLENTGDLEHITTCADSGCDLMTSGSCMGTLSNTYQASFTKKEQDKDFLAVDVVKMKSVSVDSDNSDFPEFCDLPKLEISESDLENPFDSSDNSNSSVHELDIATESATIEKLTSDLTQDILDEERNKDTCNEEMLKDLILDEKKSENFSEISGGKETEYCESTETQIDVKVLDTVISDSKAKNSNEMDDKRDCSLSEIERLKEELSDDSAIENNDEEYKDEIRNLEPDQTKGCDNENLNTSFSNINSRKDGSLGERFNELAASVELKYPGLYDDNEPTHMTISEVMSRNHPGFASVFRAESPVVGDAEFSCVHTDSLSSQHIPVSELSTFDTPPPRPPPISSSQSWNTNSNSSQSSQSTLDTPPEETSPLFRFTYGSGQSDEETPPAVPPRIRERNSNRRPASYHQDFMESMRQLKDCGWYWGPLSWEEAEIKLANKPEGTFLVRDSSDERYILSLSFKNQGRVHHTRIEHHKGHFSFWSQPESHGKSTIKEFIEQCVENSRNGRFLYFIRPSGPGSPPMPIHLLHPVSRFVQMRSLQHMCRFRILQIVRRDHIDHLPIPTRIKQYLKEAQYYVEYLDD